MLWQKLHDDYCLSSSLSLCPFYVYSSLHVCQGQELKKIRPMSAHATNDCYFLGCEILWQGGLEGSKALFTYFASASVGETSSSSSNMNCLYDSGASPILFPPQTVTTATYISNLSNVCTEQLPTPPPTTSRHNLHLDQTSQPWM